jgi:hypothetical protein
MIRLISAPSSKSIFKQNVCLFSYRLIEISMCTVVPKTTVVCLLVEGGPRSLRQVIASVKCNIPVLVCDGTGRLSDLLAQTMSDKSEQTYEEPARIG